jgi:hypothetical protein
LAYICIVTKGEYSQPLLKIRKMTTEELKNKVSEEGGMIELTDDMLNSWIKEEEAKELIEKDNEIGKKIAKAYASNKKEYKRLVNKSIELRMLMIDKYGESNFSAYQTAGRKNQLNALLFGKAPKVGFQLKKNAGCRGIEA